MRGGCSYCDDVMTTVTCARQSEVCEHGCEVLAASSGGLLAACKNKLREVVNQLQNWA